MTRLLRVAILFLAASISFFPPNAYSGGEKTLYARFSDKDEVKTYIADIVDVSGAAKADLVALKKEIENALVTRQTIKFRIVPTPPEADIIIGCDITEYLWMDEDPIDEVYGVIGVAMDASSNEHYARLQAIFSVVDVKTQKPLWQEKLQATVTDKTMTPEDSISMVNERIIKVFIREAFSKPRQR